MAELRARLDEHQVVLLGLLLALLRRDLALVVQVRLVADEDDDDVVAALAAYVVDPFVGLVEGFGVYMSLMLLLCVLKFSRSMYAYL